MHVAALGMQTFGVAHDLLDEHPADEAVHIHLRRPVAVPVGIVAHDVALQTVDVVLDPGKLHRLHHILVRVLDHDREFVGLAGAPVQAGGIRIGIGERSRIELVGLIHLRTHLDQVAAGDLRLGHVRGLHLLDGHALGCDLDVLDQVVVADVGAVEHQLHELAARGPVKIVLVVVRGQAAAQLEGYVVAHTRAVHRIGQQIPAFVLGHAQQVGLGVQLEGVGLLVEVLPGRVAAAADGGRAEVRHRPVGCLQVGVGLDPGHLVHDGCVIVSIDIQGRQAGVDGREVRDVGRGRIHRRIVRAGRGAVHGEGRHRLIDVANDRDGVVGGLLRGVAGRVGDRHGDAMREVGGRHGDPEGRRLLGGGPRGHAAAAVQGQGRPGPGAETELRVGVRAGGQRGGTAQRLAVLAREGDRGDGRGAVDLQHQVAHDALEGQVGVLRRGGHGDHHRRARAEGVRHIALLRRHIKGEDPAGADGCVGIVRV